MEMSQEIGKISEALAKAQIEMTNAAFDSKNPHFNSRYASLASVNLAIKPLSKNGIAVIQSVSVGRADGVYVTVTTMLSHASGQFFKNDVTLKAIADDAQKIGSVVTYARRYSLSAMCGVASDEDDDANSTLPDTKKPSDPKGKDKQPDTKKPETKKPDVNQNANNQVNPEMKQRVEFTKKIHEIASKIGLSPNDMKVKISGIIKRPFESSSELKLDEFPKIISEFEAELSFVTAKKEEAAKIEDNKQT